MTSKRASDLVADRLRELRQRRGWTAEQLAERCAEAGAPEITRSVIANIESGRRDKDGKRRRAVTVEELLALAYVLEVPPVLLLSPINAGETLEVTSKMHKGPLDAADWIADDNGVLVGHMGAHSAAEGETEEILRRSAGNPLTILRQVRLVSNAIRLGHKQGTQQGIEEEFAWIIARRGTRLLHLLRQLSALGYEPLELPDVMEILSRPAVAQKMREEAAIPIPLHDPASGGN